MDTIRDKLRKLEDDENITILYAVESGSRAWGHHNKNSDYDIRFIYKYNSINHYLTINSQSDVIESNDGLYDIVGWDIKKALHLHYKSNPNLREWILSPIKYIPMKEDIFINLPEFDKEVLKHHYYGLTKRHYRKYIMKSEKTDIKLFKKLLYTIRCILAFTKLDEDIFPSMNMDDLIEENTLDKSLEEKIIKLRDAYSQLDKSLISDDEVEFLTCWVVNSLEYMQNHLFNPHNNKDIDMYNRRFQEIILE